MAPLPVKATKVTTTEIPLKVMIVRAEPNFEANRRKVISYEFPGRVFTEDPARQGPYSTVPNTR